MKKVLFLFAMMVLFGSAMAFDFSSVAPTGQTLFYNIIGGTAQITTQNSTYPYYISMPSGNLTIPSTVIYNGTTYNVTTIGHHAFYCCGLTSVTIPNGVTSIEVAAFAGCNSLTSVIIPNSVTNIGDQSFASCHNLDSITLPNSIESIGFSAFGGTGINAIQIPESVTNIAVGAFCTCNSLMSITVANGNPVYDSRDNCNAIIHTASNELISGCRNSIIPNTVVSIGDGAFGDLDSLFSIYIPNSVMRIGMSSFANCDGLTTVTIPNSVTNICSEAFWQCSALSSVTIGNSIDSIGNRAFFYCVALDTITILANIPPNLGTESFWGVTLDRINIPCGTYADYSTASVWGWSFSSILVDSIYRASYQINLVSGNPEKGYATIIQDETFHDLRCDTSVVICAIPNNGYHFKQWSNGSNANPDTVFITENTTLTAYFCGLITLVDSVSHGTVSHYKISNFIEEIHATPSYGYHFDHWSNGSTSNPDTLFISGDSIITAYFAKNQYTVTALANQNERGTVAGGAMVDYLDNVTLTATANYGYHFSHWSDGSTENPHQVTANENKTIYAYFDPNQYLLNVLSADGTMGNVSGSGSFDYLSNRTISASPNYGYHFVQWNDGVATNSRTVTLTQDTTFTALFGKNQYTLNVLSNDASLGTVTGSGTYEYLDNAEIIATAIEHYHFVRWSDGNTSNPRNYQVTEDATIIAIFAIDSHYVNVTCDIARGTVSGSGYYAYGSACTVTAENTYTGFVFHSWSNGVTANPYVFAVLDDMEVYAIFVAEGEEVYTVTVESADPSMGTASGGGQALSGGEVVIWATSNPGHRFVRWNDNNTDSVRTVVVTADVTYTAYFEATTQSINDVMEEDIKIFVQNGQIVVDGVDDKDVRVFDMYGRLVDNRMLSPGVYLIKIGDHPARKVVVIR